MRSTERPTDALPPIHLISAVIPQSEPHIAHLASQVVDCDSETSYKALSTPSTDTALSDTYVGCKDRVEGLKADRAAIAGIGGSERNGETDGGFCSSCDLLPAIHRFGRLSHKLTRAGYPVVSRY